jgi:uncharacterized protein YjiS (DUF1127 family)
MSRLRRFSRILGYPIVTIHGRFAEWRLRVRTRALLMALDDHTLKDIGLKRADVSMKSDYCADPRWERPTISTMSPTMAFKSKSLGL